MFHPTVQRKGGNDPLVKVCLYTTTLHDEKQGTIAKVILSFVRRMISKRDDETE